MSKSKKLFNKDFVLLITGQTVSQLGNGAGFIATMWWVQSTTGSALALGTVAMIKALVAVLLSPFAGVFADRLSRKNIIVISDIVNGLVYGYFAWAAWHGVLSLPILYIGSAITAASFQFFSPAVMASVPQLVPEERLEQANSLRQVSQNVTNIISYALGGVLVAVLGVPVLLLVDALSFGLSALSEMFIVIPKVIKETKFSWDAFTADLKDGLGYIKKQAVLYNMLFAIAVINFAFVPFFLLLPKFVADHLGGTSAMYGYISSSMMAGMLIGTMLISLTKVIKGNMWLIKWGISMQAGVFIIAPFIPGQYWYLQMVIYGLFGVLNSIINISFFSILQREVESKYAGKVFSLITAVALGLQPLASGLSGWLADTIPISTIFVGAAVLGVLGNIKLALVPGINKFYGITKEKTVEAEVAHAN